MIEIIESFNNCIKKFGEGINKCFYKEKMKIKEAVDLNILLDYGFNYEEQNGKYIYCCPECVTKQRFIKINSWNRIIECDITIDELLIVHRLFTDDLIEIIYEIL